MMKLYFNPKSRAVVARWMLDECGAEYKLEAIDLQKREQKSHDYLQINPAGKLPALVDGTSTVFENAAICLYLAEKFPKADLAPPPGSPDRGRYLSFMVWSTSQLEPAMGDHLGNVKSDNSSRGWIDFDHCLKVVEDQLGVGPWLFGARFSAADVMVGSMFMWMRMWGKETGSDRLDKFVDRLVGRPKAFKPEV